MISGKNQKFCRKTSWGQRHVLVSMCFIMGTLLYSLRFNLSIGIVAMVRDASTSESNTRLVGEQRISHKICPSPLENWETTNSNSSQIQALLSIQKPLDSLDSNILLVNSSRHISHNFEKSTDSGHDYPTFEWDEKDQGLILGAFFWGYMITQFPGGLLSQKYGGKWVVSCGILSTGLLSIVLPYAAIYGGKTFVVIVRILQGLSEGFVIPGFFNLLSKWTPPEERARLYAVAVAGLPFGTAITMLVSGEMISAWGWPSVFLLPGGISIFAFIIWTWIVHSSPEEHPNISQEELKYIRRSLVENENGNEKCTLKTVPWKKLFTSVPAWSIFISQFCNCWGHNMLKSEGPKYLHQVLDFDIHENGLVSSLPFFLQMAFALFVGRMSDFLLERKMISMLCARKICNTIGQWGMALCFVIMILSGCNRLPAVIFYIASGMVNGSMNCGAFVNIIDISPKYSSILEGIINCVANIAGFGAPYLAGLILFYQPSFTGWAYVFLFPVILNVLGNGIFLLGASATDQKWENDTDKKNKSSEEEK